MRSCYFCGRTDWIECHHIFQGAYRRKSEQYGFVIDLCHRHHNEPPDGVHHNRQNNLILKRKAQTEFEKTMGTREEFIKIFGRNYL